MSTKKEISDIKKINFCVNGMHCKSCEILLEQSLKEINNITKVHADSKKGTVEVYYELNQIELSEVRKVIEDSGYKIGEKQKQPWINKDSKVYRDFGVVIISLFALYLIFSVFGFNIANYGNLGSPTFGIALLLGLTAGVSSCMALVGGLVLGVSTKWNEDHNNYSRYRKFEPHLFFNLGRIIGFGILGGILGLFGHIFSISPFALGIITVVTGLVMLFLGFNLTELSPKLSSLTLTLPKFLGKNVGNNKGGSKHIFAFTTGALTFFLPCGFTLAMQTYAITTGSFISGALIMMAFAIGTAPGLLGVGGLSSFFSGKNAKILFRTTGVIVLILALFNISNGFTLMSLGGKTPIIQNHEEVNPGETQEIRMTQDSNGYSPIEFHIKPNTKTKWIINATNQYSCSIQILIPSLGVNKTLQKGDNVIEFVSPASGEIKFSCGMGMYPGKIVIDSK